MFDNRDLVLYLPYPPSINDYYGHNKNTVYVKKNGKDYRELVESVIRSQYDGEVMSVPLRVGIDVIPPVRKRRRDLDNLLKALLDAITESKRVWEDDSLILELNMKWIENGDEKNKNGSIKMYINQRIIRNISD